MARFNTAPVQPEKIQLIKDLLNDAIVGDYYHQWLRLKSSNAHIQIINKAFTEYAIARDRWLGLPPLVIQGIQGTNRTRARFY